MKVVHLKGIYSTKFIAFDVAEKTIHESKDLLVDFYVHRLIQLWLSILLSLRVFIE